MNSRQAKDFLVGQAAEQAAIEGIPLSELEKRMMYFTEGPDAVEDPVQLNEEFEAAYEMEEYETKVSQLLKHARARLSFQNRTELDTWKQAVATLRAGDHYVLIMLGGFDSMMPSPSSWPWTAIARFSIRLGVPIAVLVGIIALLRNRFGALPMVSSYVFFTLFVAVYLLGLAMSRGAVPKPVARIGKAITVYLFGK